MSYWFLLLVTMAIGFGTQAFINSSFKKYSRVDNGSNVTGAQIARRMLDDNNLQEVEIRRVSGNLTDHYDPRSRTVNLSDDVYGSTSVSALAVACHECGHAVQDARNYVPLKIRSALVPVANFGSSLWLILVIAGLFLNIMGLFWVGIIFYAFAVLFQIVTLPVEFNASHRALDYVKAGGNGAIAPAVANSGASTVLTAAALTYVAAALTSIMQLIYFIGMARD